MTSVSIKTILFFILIVFSSALFAQIEKVNYGTGSWNADSLGNHRAVVAVKSEGNAVRVVIPWRRRDFEPEKKKIIAADSVSGKIINNVKVVSVSREAGELIFEPVSGAGNYFVYYFPYKSEGKSNYPKGIYLEPVNNASPEWLNKIANEIIPDAVCRRIEAVDEFNSFYPMEVIATKKETDEIIKQAGAKPFILFPEDREYPIKMDSDLPLRWIERGTVNEFKGSASRGENYTYQIGIFALKDLKDVKVDFSPLKSKSGSSIPVINITRVALTL